MVAERYRWWACAPLVVLTVVAVMASARGRWALALETAWQCDEIPLLVRSTGLCGRVKNELEARTFQPNRYSFAHGALRSLRPPKYSSAIHTSTAFWVNLTIHLWGCSPGAGRVGPLFWSMAGIATTGLAAWLVSRSLVAVCLAAWFVALSPFATAYAAQARGYAEALALTPLLLVALEYFRRATDRWLRAILVFLCAALLSLTVYTAWIYWVLPTLAFACIALPKSMDGGHCTRATRACLIATFAGVCGLMTVFTLDRWDSLSFTSERFGVPWKSMADVWDFVTRLMEQVMPLPLWTAVAALAGIGALWRTPMRWWVGAIFAGVAIPATFGIFRGSPGYPRNLGFLLAPLAILWGLGVHRLYAAVTRKFSSVGVVVLALTVMGAASVWSYAGLSKRARAQMPPDWGGVALELASEPALTGPRWFCPCLANHWQVVWYGACDEGDSVMRVAPGGRIEVAMGAQFENDGRPRVFRIGSRGNSIVEDPLPTYLATVPVAEAARGLEVRRWHGTRVSLEDASEAAVNDPVFLAAVVDLPADDARWRRFWEKSGAYEAGVVSFKIVPGSNGPMWCLISPARAVKMLCSTIQSELGVDERDMRCFVLSPIRNLSALNAN